MMDKLAAYKLDKAFTDGVDIYLDDAPDVPFRIRLPSQYNRAYSQALYGGMQFQVDAEGKVKPGADLIATRYAQEDAFLAHCLLSIDGEAPPEHFAQDYPAAMSELLNKATELANDLESTVSTSVKKSPTSSTGSESGQDGKSSIGTLKNAAR